ncbi:30S ribosomal protein S18 [Candidatus Parcubacteria bacterium]|nr:30S ribosomal protein S18 [Patescibacteria group bacterium]MCG2693770.1 30S ribosomal protein S18 [Candidatus Parcubacteria bacterium]
MNKNIQLKPRMCYFCINNMKEIDYKDTTTLKKFISSYGKIVPRKRSKVCMKHQRKMSQAIKRARIMGLLPFLVQ